MCVGIFCLRRPRRVTASPLFDPRPCLRQGVTFALFVVVALCARSTSAQCPAGWTYYDDSRAPLNDKEGHSSCIVLTSPDVDPHGPAGILFDPNDPDHHVHDYDGPGANGVLPPLQGSPVTFAQAAAACSALAPGAKLLTISSGAATAGSNGLYKTALALAKSQYSERTCSCPCLCAWCRCRCRGVLGALGFTSGRVFPG